MIDIPLEAAAHVIALQVGHHPIATTVHCTHPSSSTPA